MNILLDTHMLIWALNDNPKFSAAAREMVMNSENEIFYSVVSLWEIEMKHGTKPDNLPITAHSVMDFSNKAGYKLIYLKENSVLRLPTLSRPDTEPPHKDPFDRILICQALAENMTLLTHDALFKGYDLGNIVIA